MRSESLASKLLIPILVGMALGGCGLTDRTTLDTCASIQFPAAEDSLDFWDTLETQPVTTNDDALHGLLLFVEHSPVATTWDERVAAARAAGWLSSDNTPPPALESAQMGFVAPIVCEILQVQGGLSMRLWGRTPRYSTRELVHMGLIPGITEHEALSGAEFIALLSAAEQRQLMDRVWAARTQAATPADSPSEHPPAGSAQPADESTQAPPQPAKAQDATEGEASS